MLYEAEDGRLVMVLAEWKYSESYGAAYKRFRSDGSDRVESYREIFFGLFTPIDLTVAPRLEDFLYEPAYQLCRQQLLASRIIELGEPAVDEVVLVHIAVSENRELRNVTSPRLRELGRDLYTLWPSLLVEPSTFKLISTVELFKSLPTDRYPELEPWEHYMRSRYSFLKLAKARPIEGTGLFHSRYPDRALESCYRGPREKVLARGSIEGSKRRYPGLSFASRAIGRKHGLNQGAKGNTGLSVIEASPPKSDTDVHGRGEALKKADTTRILLTRNMKRLREALGLSQMSLAERVGCSTTLIGNIETLKRFPSAENLDRIAAALEVPVANSS